ncbi:PaaI family thioesterase [Ideonella sp. DXS29W]|uniref:PaaI family thioesterase n=1 Tax=Ideonella lacteola TaxID=2984193 RepID=A0ABU9BI08_9BURK
MTDSTSPVGVAELQSLLATMFAPWVQELDLVVRAVEPDGVMLALPVGARHVHGGGVLCGQTLMAAADTAMVLAVSAHLGGFRPMTTVQLQTSFMRPVPKDVGEVTVVARVLKPGRQLYFGEIECLLPDGKLATHATTTYALL